MKRLGNNLVLSATDLAGFLNCRHLSGLDLSVADGGRRRPTYDDPLIDLLFERGAAHEKAYVDSLTASGRSTADLSTDRKGREDTIARTVAAMKSGVDVVVQGALGDDRWFGYPDILLRVDRPSDLGDWSYEVVDTKLARVAKAGMILQLCLYSDLLGAILGSPPEQFHIVTPDPVHPKLSFRFEDYVAYYRLVRRQCLATVARGADAVLAGHYPEPVEHCEVCAWARVCRDRRRADDHLSLIAGVSRVQRRELEGRGAGTLTAVAGIPLPIDFRPERGSKESYARVREQARVQLASRGRETPVHELIDCEPGFGLGRLPEPSAGDVFLDLEGDPFAAEGGREYLFGLVTVEGDGSTRYHAFWAFTEAEERVAFEAAIDLIMAARDRWPDMHVYHYAPYEPSSFKRLMGRHATRGDELDQLLREERFVDLLAVVRQGLRVGVESYSIKRLEPLYGFERTVALDTANRFLQAMAAALERGSAAFLPDEIRSGVAGYNEDDCVSTLRLRDWLETVRAEAIAAGKDLPRLTPSEGSPSANVDERARRVEELRGRLLVGIPAERSERTAEEDARWILAYLLDWHRREDRAGWWEYFRMRELPVDELYEERKALAGLEFIRSEPVLNKKGRPTGSVIDRYRYPAQEMEIDPGNDLELQAGGRFGKVVAVDRAARTVDIKKGRSRVGEHPIAVFEYSHISPAVIENALFAVGEAVAADGSIDVFAGAVNRAGRELLLRNPPRLVAGAFDGNHIDPDSAARMVLQLDHSVLAIQGPPGSGKTYCAARMILAAVRAGQRVGVTATSHKVIHNLLGAVVDAAGEAKVTLGIGHRGEEDETGALQEVQWFSKNPGALAAVADGRVQVLGGTVWLWAHEDARAAVDVLFVDEAGQISLANTLAASGAARNLVLLGDPQQLDQPLKGTHPPGADGSALSHILGDHQTMPRERGLFLPVTWRLAPSIADYTSVSFYERKLRAADDLDRQVLTGTGRFSGSGLWVVDVEHDGNRNFSEEEIEAVEGLVRELTVAGATWTDRHGLVRPIGGAEILIVAPYNAQVSRLVDRLDGTGVRVGTVDKFQGQEAPVVIYTMATSRAEDAPRGMEFLYSLNRLNVATSRARCAAILVASPRLYEPECRSPRQMRLANALCRFREMATVV